MTMVSDLGKQARKAALEMATLGSSVRDGALRAMAQALRAHCGAILQANAEDRRSAGEKGVKSAFIERLTLTEARVEDMARGLEEVAALPDPIGTADRMWTRPNGLRILQKRVPLGVVGIIFESRPNVTSDAAAICIKSGNACILRGGSEAIHSNLALAGLLHEALRSAGLPEDAAQVVETTDRAAVAALCKLDKYVDVMIPRGGESLVRAVCEAATMPVLKHYMGVCHLYIDEGADLGMALRLAHNGKVQRPGVCNALECLLVHEKEAAAFLPMLAGKLGADGVEFRADARALPLLSGAKAVPAQPGDFGQEFHDLILAVRVVDSLDDALDHIASYGSNHTEVICTNNHANATRFLREADASLTAVNASTRFNDGGQLGLGAEIGICTSKLHSYGAMGVRELTTTKFVALGTGQIRE